MTVQATAPALTLVPPPSSLPPRPRGLGYQFWRCWNALSFIIRFTFLGDMILRRIAPRRMREAAWLAGFALAAGHDAPWQWLLQLLREYSDGNEAGLCVMPLRDRRAHVPRQRRRDRFLPVSRARHEAKINAIFSVMFLLGRSGSCSGSGDRPRLGVADPAKWAEDAS